MLTIQLPQLLYVLSKDRVPAAMVAAAAAGHLYLVKRLLQGRGNDVGGLLKPLWRAAAGGHSSTVELLLPLLDVTKVNAMDKKTGSTALWMAAQNSHVEVVRALILGGANTDAVCDIVDGDSFRRRTQPSTALVVAAQNGRTEVVSVLLESRAAVDQTPTNGDGQTALSKAAAAGHVEVCRVLLQAGANIEAADNNGATALFWALKNSKLRVIAMLLEEGASIDAVEAAEAGGVSGGGGGALVYGGIDPTDMGDVMGDVMFG
jgi:ankyrin repeat protein